MRLKQYITEGKKMTDPLIGFGFNYSDIKNVVDYIESELIQENIRYQHPDDYHLTLAIIVGTYDKDELVRFFAKEALTRIENYKKYGW
jgi:hypothetical protein